MKNIRMKSIALALPLIMAIQSQAQSLQEAVQFFKYDRFESAKKILTPLSATDAQANYLLGLSELGAENISSAKAIFSKFPDDVANMAGMARVLFLEKKKDEALALLQKATAKAKKKDVTPFKYAADAITYSDGGDPNMAVEWYKKVMDVEKTGDLHIAIGDAYRKIQGKGGDAMTNYEYAESFDATKSLANQKMGNLWYAAKIYDSALAKYNRAAQLDENNPLPYKSLADAYYKVGKYSISKTNIEKYLALSDKTTDDKIQYANTLYLAKEYSPAIEKMNELINSGIEKPYMYRVLAYSQYELKDYKTALSNMDKLFAKQDPAKIIPQDYLYYGKILLTDSTKTAQADSYFEKGINADTSSDKTILYRGLAESFKDVQKYTSAAKWYKKITESNATSVEALDYWWGGVMNFYAKDYSNAEVMFTQMSTKYPDEPSCYYWLGRSTVALKDKDYKTGAASAYYTKWLGLINDDAKKKNDLINAYTYLAMVAYNTKNKVDAEKYCNKLLQFDTTNKTAKDILANLPTMK